MMTIEDFMEVVNYRITEGSEYCWFCFGPNSYCLTSWNGEQDGHSVNIVFDTESQEVYQIDVNDYSNVKAYRWTNPAYVEAYRDEAKNRCIDNDFAWEDEKGKPVKYIELEVEDDFLDKARSIVNGEEYDERVKVPLDLSKDEMYRLMMLAHENDMTLNEYVIGILEAKIGELKSGDLDAF